MFYPKFLCLSALLAQAFYVGADQSPAETTPTARDGQYVTNPMPGPGNSLGEWWWSNLLLPPTSEGVVPALDIIFYLGSFFSRPASDPSYSVVVSGVLPNGTNFYIPIPVTNQPVITTSGQGVKGDWGGLAKFELSPNREILDFVFNATAFGVSGRVKLRRDRTPARSSCGLNETAKPYFSSLSAGKQLNANETTLYDQLGWFVTMPRAIGQADVNIGDYRFVLRNATGFHDHNWTPKPINQYIHTWLTGQGSCGPIDLSYAEIQAIGSSRSNDILAGSLAENGRFLSSQCSVYGQPTSDKLIVTPTGNMTDPFTKVQVPTGLNLEYQLPNGKQYTFNLTGQLSSPAVPIYHRWHFSGKGGEVGGRQYNCLLMGDWVNPAVVPYQVGKSIFDF